MRRRFLATATLTLGAWILSTAAVYGQAAAPAQPQWKSQEEYDLVQAIYKDTNAATRLVKLDDWKKKFAETDFASNRRLLYMGTYLEANKLPEFFTAADEVVAAEPNNFQALTAMAVNIYRTNPPSPSQLDSVTKGCSHVVNNTDAVFPGDKVPQGVQPAAWEQTKSQTKLLCQNTLGWAAMMKKDHVKAEEEFEKALKLEGKNAQITYWLATSVIAQKDIKKYPKALYHLARAANYTGPGELPEATRKQVQPYFERVYKGYHGDMEGADKVIAVAKENALPPDGWEGIEDAITRANKDEKGRKDFATKNPDKALWKTIKETLAKDDGASYFENTLKGALLPGGAPAPDTDPPIKVTAFKGVIVGAEPEVNPKELKIAISNSADAEVTLKLDAPLKGKLEPNLEVGFEGIPSAFTKEPFNLVFDVEKAKLTGLPAAATGAAGAKPVGRRPVGKKR